jgi:hypothetical protein
MVVGDYHIIGLFVIILLMAIGEYFVNGYW